jgi:cell division protein FtsQ
MLRRSPTPPVAAANPAADAEVRWMNATSQVLFSVAALAAVFLLAQWLARQPVFALRGIAVVGDVSHNSVATLRANALPAMAGNYFSMDLQRSQKAFAAVPWVRQAVVQRVWPNRIQVQLEEHRVAAIWSPDEATARTGSSAIDRLVNTHGEVFDANLGDVEDQELITLRGPEGSAAQMLAMAKILAPIWNRLQATVDELSMSGRGSWRVLLDTGAVIELGRGSPAELLARCEQFVATVGQFTALYQRPVQYADLRHRDGYALRLRGISTTLSTAERAAVDAKPKSTATR